MKKKINDFIKAHLPRIHEDIFNLKKYIDYFKKQIEQTEIQEIQYDSNDEDSDDGNEENQPNSLQITKENISDQLEIIRQVEHHQMIAEKQRDAYNKMTNDPKFYENSIMMDFDFKQKIVFGKQPVFSVKYLKINFMLIL